jgi:hypothetical protein
LIYILPMSATTAVKSGGNWFSLLYILLATHFWGQL